MRDLTDPRAERGIAGPRTQRPIDSTPLSIPFAFVDPALECPRRGGPWKLPFSRCQRPSHRDEPSFSPRANPNIPPERDQDRSSPARRRDRRYPERCNPNRTRPPLDEDQKGLASRYFPLARSMARTGDGEPAPGVRRACNPRLTWPSWKPLSRSTPPGTSTSQRSPGIGSRVPCATPAARPSSED